MRSQPIDHLKVITDGIIYGPLGRIWLRRRQRLMLAGEAMMLQGFTISDPDADFASNTSYMDMIDIAARESANGFVTATLLTSVLCCFPCYWWRRAVPPP